MEDQDKIRAILGSLVQRMQEELQRLLQSRTHHSRSEGASQNQQPDITTLPSLGHSHTVIIISTCCQTGVFYDGCRQEHPKFEENLQEKSYRHKDFLYGI